MSHLSGGGDDVAAGGMIYGLEFQCRSLCAVNGENEKIVFLVGTQSLKTRNEIHEICVEEEDATTPGTLHKQIYAHPKGEIWQLVSSNSGN